MTKTLLAFAFYLLGGFWLAAAADVSKQVPAQNAEVNPKFDNAAARNALFSGDDLYCSRVTSGEQELAECLRKQAEYAEHELNDTYRTVMTQLPPARQDALRKEERGWIKWREAECAKQVKDVEECVNGCGVPGTMRVVCMTNEAVARAKQLKIRWHR